jgi:hypothetical protein
MWHNVLRVASVAVCFCLTACGPDHVKRYDKPLTYAQAAKEREIDFPLPASSHDIYYGMYADWQAYTLVVRFEAPVDDCIKHMATAVAWNDKVYKRTSSYPRVSVTNVDYVNAGGLDPVPWFTPHTITHGLFTGTNSSHTPEIWVDLDKGIFYFKETD